MGLPLRPAIPGDAVPLHVDGLHRVLEKSRFWLRLATLATVAAAGGALFLALTTRIVWPLAIPFLLAPYLPIAAGTRVEEALRIIEDQVRGHAPAGRPADGPG